MESLEQFLESKITDLEKRFPLEKLNVDVKSDIGYKLKHMALLFFRDKEKEIVEYLVSKGYDPIKGEERENERRLLRKTQLEQLPNN